MSWNNQGGPWRSPGRGPSGKGPFGPQPTGDIEEIIRRVQEALGKLTPGGSGRGGKGPGGGALFLALAALLLWFAWGTSTPSSRVKSESILCLAAILARRPQV